jgi:hypothetical protein
MGSWTTQAETKAERCAEIIADCNWENDKEKSVLVAKRVTNTGLWTLQTITSGDKVYNVLTFHKMHKSGSQWWVKSMDTSCGPMFWDCPKALVKKWRSLNGDYFVNDWEQQWYDRWLETESLWKKITELKSGDQVMVGTRKVVFKFWHRRTTTTFFVGHEVGSTQLYRWITANIKEIL